MYEVLDSEGAKLAAFFSGNDLLLILCVETLLLAALAATSTTCPCGLRSAGWRRRRGLLRARICRR